MCSNRGVELASQYLVEMCVQILPALCINSIVVGRFSRTGDTAQPASARKGRRLLPFRLAPLLSSTTDPTRPAEAALTKARVAVAAPGPFGRASRPFFESCFTDPTRPAE